MTNTETQGEKKMTSEPMVPLSEIREAYGSGEISELIARHAPVPEPLRWSIATTLSGNELLIVSESPDEYGKVAVINMSHGTMGTFELYKLTFTGERMARVKDTKARPEAALESTQGNETGLFGKWATHPDYGRGIVISFYADYDSEVKFSHAHDVGSTGTVHGYVPLDELKFDDDHPEWLVTEEDYENAPTGTVVAGASEYAPGHMSAVFQRDESGEWGEDGSPEYFLSEQMAGTRRRVLRWGGEK